MSKVIVGMSGGVDSSTAAHLLKNQGNEVEGVSFILYEARLRKTFAKAPCCSVEAMNDAGRSADRIGVSHSIVDLRDLFMEKVIEPFIDAYSRGITPNPCILCNRYVKFPSLLKIAEERGAEFIATGHYARVEEGKLLKGYDPRKDQSYVLYILRGPELKRLKLPLGHMRKDDVREIARGLGIPAAQRPESQEICFIEEKNYCGFLKGIACGGEGPIIDIESGHTVGKHGGIHLYTVGQRKRLGISTLKPRFVVRIDPSQNTVYVGPREAALMREFIVMDLNWLIRPEELESARAEMTSAITPFRASVKIRSMMRDEPATVFLVDQDRVRVVYDEPQWAPAPGQSAVFYSGDTVVGGGVIAGETGP